MAVTRNASTTVTIASTRFSSGWRSRAGSKLPATGGVVELTVVAAVRGISLTSIDRPGVDAVTRSSDIDRPRPVAESYVGARYEAVFRDRRAAGQSRRSRQMASP